MASKLGLWPELLRPRTPPSKTSNTTQRPPQSTLWGTNFAQEAIWRHQHPQAETCRNRSYFIARTGPFTLNADKTYGIGAMLHILGSNIGIAMALNRILIFHPHDMNKFALDGVDTSAGGAAPATPNTPFCHGDSSFGCFFLPLSSCTFEDAIASGRSTGQFPDDPNLHRPEKAEELDGLLNEVWYIQSRYYYGKLGDSEKRVLQLLGENGFKGKVPPQLMARLEAPDSPIAPSVAWHWWRAQAVTYLVRPNQRTRDEIRRRLGVHFKRGRVPPGTISAHVRHGDKSIEVDVLSFRDFAVAATAMARAVPGQLQVEGRPKLFVSTEDPEVIESARALVSKTSGERELVGVAEPEEEGGWEVMYTDLSRQNLPVFDLITRFGGVNEMLNGLMNLQLAVQCDAWVCTLSSNWCILIDELRSTVAEKAGNLYVDIGGGECPKGRRDVGCR